MLKEEIGIYQDPKNRKTTIVIYNMKQKTRDTLAKLLLADLQVEVETISGLTEVPHDNPILTPEIDGMTPVTVNKLSENSVLEDIITSPSAYSEDALSNIAAKYIPEPELPPLDYYEPQIVSTPIVSEPTIDIPDSNISENKTLETEAVETVKSKNTTSNSEPESALPEVIKKDTLSEATNSPVEEPLPETKDIYPTKIHEKLVPEEMMKPEQIPSDFIQPEENTDNVPVFVPIPENEQESHVDMAKPQFSDVPDDYMDHYNTQETETNVYEDIPTLNAREQVANLWNHFDENAPGLLLREFISIWESGSQEEKIAAAEEVSRLLTLVAQTRRKIQALLWDFQTFEPFTKALMSVIRQKGNGDGLIINTPEYASAIVTTLSNLSDEELMIVAIGAAKNMLSLLTPLFVIN